jgi:hypothetical protein
MTSSSPSAELKVDPPEPARTATDQRAEHPHRVRRPLHEQLDRHRADADPIRTALLRRIVAVGLVAMAIERTGLVCANIHAVLQDADAIYKAETDLAGRLYDLSFSAEYGHGSAREAIDAIRASRKHADRAVVAAAAGNALMAARHEAQAVAADADAARMLQRAEGYTSDLLSGLESAAASVEAAVSHARSLVDLDDSSPAAQIHAKIATQSEALQAYVQRAREVRSRVPGSRDPAELQVAAEHFLALRHEFEEGSGRAQEIASDATGYSTTI